MRKAPTQAPNQPRSQPVVSGLNDVYADLGGFLGIGATRTLIKSSQIQDVKDDRIVLTLTEVEAKNLPATVEEKPTSPPQ